jgi:uncharacterized protein YodC (DUF2158 family)
MSNMLIQIGSSVHLKSGSPDLTVVAIEKGVATVEWVRENGALDRAVFPLVCLI